MTCNIAKVAGALMLLGSLGACATDPTYGGYTRPGELVSTQQFVSNVLTDKGVIRPVSGTNNLSNAVQEEQ